MESLARQIRVTGRAYPLFDIAQLILQKPERHVVRFDVIKNAGGESLAQPLFLCALDDSLWLSEDEVAQHVLARHFGTFYQAEKTPTDPPKGTYTFVAQCGLSGAYPWAAELSRLPNQIAQAACGTIFADAVRRI